MFWRRFLWGFVILLIGLVSYVWVQRYALIETQVRKWAKSHNYDITLDIQSVTKRQAHLKTIVITQDGQAVFKASHLVADYQWKDVLDHKIIEKLTLKDFEAVVELDAKGQISHPKLPQTQGPALPFPTQGIVMKRGHVALGSPFGSLKGTIDGYYQSMTAAKIAFQVEDVAFDYKELNGAGTGQVNVKLSEMAPDLDLDMMFSHIGFQEGYIDDVNIVSDMAAVLSPEQVGFDGPISIELKRAETSEYSVEAAQLNWEGQIDFPRTDQGVWHAAGAWVVDIDEASVKSAVKREKLARTVSLYSALSKAPMVRNFANLPKAAFLRLFNSASLSGKGRFEFSPDGYAVDLDAPMVIGQGQELGRGQDKLRLVPRPDIAAVRFDLQANYIDLNMDVDLEGPWPLRLQNLSLKAGSDDGKSFNAVESVKARLNVPRPWKAQTIDGASARLGALSGDLIYRLSNNDQRFFNFIGPVDYDGDVPGGYVTGLMALGRTEIISTPTRLSADFQPKSGHLIKVARLSTQTQWRGEDLSFTISGKGPDYRRRGRVEDGAVGKISTRLEALKGQVIDAENTRHLSLDVSSVDITGTLAGEDQNWRLDSTHTQVISPNLPEGGSKTFAPTAQMTVRRRGDAPVDFTIHAPKTDVETRSVNAQGMDLKVRGEPEDFTVAYSQGRAKFIADELPVLPLFGEVRFKDQIWRGEAQTTLPKTNDTPIYVSYTFENGRGEADVSIPELIFSPGGFQPQSLSSAFRGKIADVDGVVSAQIKLAFSPDMPLQSSGRASLRNLSAGTLPGPFTGVNTELTFASIFPLQTSGRQRLTMKSFDPGFPLQNGDIEFELQDGGVKLHAAKWPLGAGFVSLDPTFWRYASDENRVTLRLTNLSLGDVVNAMGNGEMQATGNLEGELPVVIEGVRTRVEKGTLRVKNGGTIQYQSKRLDALTDNLSDQNASGSTRETSAQFGGLDGLARLNPLYREGKVSGASEGFEALKNFKYKRLEAQLDGPLDGNLIVRAEFDGSNDAVLGGAVFAWDVTLEGELLNIARSLGDITASDLIKRSLSEAQNSPS